MKNLPLHMLLLLSTGSVIGCNGDKGDSGVDDAEDTEAPVISLNGDNPLLVEYGDTFTDPGATVTDNVDTDLTATVSGTVDTSALGDYTLSYDATDSSGNAAATVTRTVQVVDTEAPVITLLGDNPLVIPEGGTFTDPGSAVSDNVDTGLSATVSGTVDTSRAGIYTLSYDATDASGNAAATVTRTVEVAFEGHLFLAANGPDLSLIGLRPDGTLAERDVFPLGDLLEGYNDDTHVVFGITRVPDTNTVYVSSFNHCGGGVWRDIDGCWGNARIDRFTYDTNTLTHEGLAYLMQPPLRALTPSYDSATSELTITILNQGSESMDILAAYESNLPEGATLLSDCDGVTLAPGESCDLTISGAAEEDTFYFGMDTSEGYSEFYTFYSEDTASQLAAPTSNYWPTVYDRPMCTYEAWWYANQYGGCAPTALSISQDGARLYVNEDDYDQALVMEINSDGTLSFLSESEDSVRLQGIAVSGDRSALYNGSNAYSIDADIITKEASGSGGNATEVVEYGGVEMLVSTLNNNTLGAYDLADPLAPATISTLSPSGGGLFQHHSADVSLFVTVGFSALTTVSFDGATLSELASQSVEYDIPCKDCDYDAYNRGVQVTPAGDYAVISAFVNVNDEYTLSTIPYQGIVTAFAIDSTGVPTEVSRLELPGKSRTILLVPPVAAE